VSEAVGEATNRRWSTDEARVLAAIYFNASFSIGDDARDECRAIADCLGRTPASIDRQWRNLAAVVHGKPGNIGDVIRQVAREYLSSPQASRKVALQVCARQGWPLEDLITAGEHAIPLREPQRNDMNDEFTSALCDFSDRLDFKVFASGSQGFYRQGKLQLSSGKRFQTQVTAVLIGSKQDLTIKLVASAEEIAFELRPYILDIKPKQFRTGRVGFYVNGKISIGLERYQVAIQAVEIKGK
jgi:hypothetical protein